MCLNYNRLFLLFFCSLNLSLNAELLILKRNQETGYIAPLSQQEAIVYGPAVCKILLKYQWPMCIASDLTEDEKNDLLTADHPYAEEQFIEKKLNETIQDINLCVAFIPTSLYELFEIIEFFIARANQNSNSFMEAAKTVDQQIKMNSSQLDNQIVQLLNTNITKATRPAHIRKAVFNVYSSMNSMFYSAQLSRDREIPILKFNFDLIQFLSTHIPHLFNVSTGQELTQTIHDQAMTILMAMNQTFQHVYARRFLGRDVHQHTSQLNLHVIAQVMRLEYEARKINKALLLRGSKLIKVPTGPEKTAQVIGHTVHTPENADNLFKTTVENYKRNPAPFTISFGSSLFAGYINNQGGCAYSYLTMPHMAAQNFTGSVVFINKKDQYEHHSSNLFFIPPLAPVAALFQYGYLFHARAKAAIRSKNMPIQKIFGAPGVLFQDPTGMIIITRDPFKHTVLFSEFLETNSVLIELNPTTDAQNRSNAILKAQKKSTDFYKALNTIQRYSNKPTRTKQYKQQAS